MTAFPSGWTLTVDTNGTVASITVAALPGIAHVLDSFTARLVNATFAGVANNRLLLSSSGGTFTNLVLARLAADQSGAGPPATNPSDLVSGSELNLAALAGESLTVAFDVAAAGQFEFLLIQGHDI